MPSPGRGASNSISGRWKPLKTFNTKENESTCKEKCSVTLGAIRSPGQDDSSGYMPPHVEESAPGVNDLSTGGVVPGTLSLTHQPDTFLWSGGPGHRGTFRSKPHPFVTTQNVPRPCQVSPGGQNHLQLRSIIL